MTVRNWTGSSKGMEPNLGIELLKSVQTEKAGIKTLIMDDDASTITHVRREFDEDMTKWSDSNHSKKSVKCYI